MGKLTDDDLREIIKRATIIQKYHRQSLGKKSDLSSEEEPIFEITDSLDIERHFVKEALLEFEGIYIDEPVSVDTNSSHNIEIRGYANGNLESSLLNELRNQIEYEFNNVGKVTRRKGNIFWNAKPAFPAKLFDITSSPEVEFSEKNGRVLITLRQSLKTLNKLYLPSIAALLAAFMMISAVLFGAGGSDNEPLLIFGGIFIALGTAFGRFVRNRKLKHKKKALELVETLQQIMERRFQAGRLKQESKPEISLQDFESLDEELDDIEIKSGRKIKS